MTDSATAPIEAAGLRNAFLAIWAEIFGPDENEGPHWILDSRTSMFDTLKEISAAEASIPVSSQSANLAAQVNHTAFYIQSLRDGLATNFETKADWEGSWKVGTVDDAEWQALVANLQRECEWVREFATEFEGWNEEFIGGAFALVAHAAYHLGEIRQGIGIIRDRA